MKNLKILHLIQDKNGDLVFLEALKDVDFEIKRVYWISNVTTETLRGFHAHRKLDQLLICIYGRIEIMYDNGFTRGSCLLDKSFKGFYVRRGIWHTMKWLQESSILLAITSDYYDESDYIRDYQEFLKLARSGYWK